MVINKILKAAALALGALMLCGCGEKIDPDGPGGDSGNDKDKNYFRLMINLSTPVPDNHEVVFNSGADGTNFIVETDQSDWSISSDAAWCKVEKTDETPSMKATAVIIVDDYDVRDAEGNYHNLAARVCNVRVKAGKIYDKTIRVVQQDGYISITRRTLSGI